MSTLAVLKAEIADDLARSDLTTQIANAITAAIEHYKTERFFFNESYSASFSTVSTQSAYSSADDGDIPLFLEVDGVMLTDSGGTRYELSRADILDMLIMLGDGAASGMPSSYVRYNDGFLLYPIPDAVYTVTPVGHVQLAAPASDSEADNPWVVRGKGYELIRCRAKAYLYTHVIKNLTQAQTMVVAERDALEQLRSKTSRKSGFTGVIRPTQF